MIYGNPNIFAIDISLTEIANCYGDINYWKYVKITIIFQKNCYQSPDFWTTYNSFEMSIIRNILYHFKYKKRELKLKYNPSFEWRNWKPDLQRTKAYENFRQDDFMEVSDHGIRMSRFQEKCYDKIYYTKNHFKSWHTAIIPTGFIDIVMALLPKPEDLDYTESDDFCWFGDEIPAHLLEKANVRLEEIKAKYL